MSSCRVCDAKVNDGSTDGTDDVDHIISGNYHRKQNTPVDGH